MKHSLSVWGLLLLGCADSGGAGGGHAAITGLPGDSGAPKSDASTANTGGAGSGNGGASPGAGGASSGGAVTRSSGGAPATDSGAYAPDAAPSTGGGPVSYWDGSNGCALVAGTLAMCGADLDPPGDPKTRYFCSLGTVVATAPCPGECVNDQGARCVVGSGSTSGSINAFKFPSLACISCRNTNCATEQAACNADPLCSVVPKCLAGCTGWSGCKENCREAFGVGPLDDYDRQKTCFDTYCQFSCGSPDGG